MRKVALGATGINVSRLCVGTDYSDIYGGSSGARILLRGAELGVNFWDTSESYGSYPAIREALKELRRRDIVIATKSYSREVRGVKRDLEDALKEMDTDYVDIFLLHAVDSIDDFQNRREVLRFLLDKKDDGIIGCVGLSTHSASVAAAMVDVPEIEVVLAVLNFEGLRIKEGDVDLMSSALQRLFRSGKGVYLMKVLARGRLADRAGEALKFGFSFPYAHSVAVGIRNLDELEFAVKISMSCEKERINVKGSKV